VQYIISKDVKYNKGPCFPVISQMPIAGSKATEKGFDNHLPTTLSPVRAKIG
jgi:hypothetical protein